MRSVCDRASATQRAYVGRAYYNRTVSVLDRHPAKAKRQVRRPRDQWIPIAIPAIIIDEELFETAQRVSYDNSKWSPRRTEPDHWLLLDSSNAAIVV
ncbi:recombinase family protein [Mesorhizobium opportunistum]|uniref:recombinase family protein n=1 Tax=Mesorhizobium opportunistum TaxID=593909 RepID=UPI00333AF65C